MDMFSEYFVTVVSLTITGMLIIIKVLILDLLLLRSKHVPGTSIEEHHSNLIFRANRALANFNESFSAFIALAISGIFLAASPIAVNLCAVSYLLSRVTYMICYYTDARKLRSVMFGFSFTALIILLITNIIAITNFY